MLRGCLGCCSCTSWNISLSVSEGTSNSPDIWNAVNGLSQQGYEGALGAGHQTQPGGYSNLQQTHNHMVRFSPRGGVMSAQHFEAPRRIKGVCFLLRTTLHTQSWLLTSPGLSRQCPPFTATPRSTPRTAQQVTTTLLLRSFWPLFTVTPDRECCFSVSGSHRNVSAGSQTGDTLGKALASVSTRHLRLNVLVLEQSGRDIKPSC